MSEQGYAQVRPTIEVAPSSRPEDFDKRFSFRLFAKYLFRTALLACLLLVSVEAVVRFTGIANVPLYDANNKIGYVPKPNQAGRMLFRYSYIFNELSMGVPEHFTGGGTLLIGDSLVMGVNVYAQHQRLGPQLRGILHQPVWPIGAISWALQNEVEYTREHPEVLQRTDRVVLILNAFDFDMPSSWSNPVSHPRERPWSETLMLLKKYFVGAHTVPQPQLRVAKKDWKGELAYLTAHTRAPIHIFLYSDRASNKAKTNCGEFPAQIRNDPRSFCIERDPLWTAAKYLDEMHPTPATTAVMARIIANHL